MLFRAILSRGGTLNFGLSEDDAKIYDYHKDCNTLILQLIKYFYL